MKRGESGRRERESERERATGKREEGKEGGLGFETGHPNLGHAKIISSSLHFL